MISWKRVRELREEIGDDDFTEVVDLFLEEVEDVLDRMRADPDPASYEADLHFLKGSALNLGFEALGALCMNGEMRAAARKMQTRDLAEVFDTYEVSKKEFLEAQENAPA
ncbi:Hpt domain-containing protein [Roseitranquillus sediminis]|uniref:Hpt domain-containing protein n=1 Tax=Roseitranquillus sediminis TaxID=2809051 RepID=UPI001D0CD036|nr:Hpt domain-containing protein [Roseitranquillus sediminis]MBM9593811.1 Hpt domain-containing protein [Roseitranquillus sediminis]